MTALTTVISLKTLLTLEKGKQKLLYFKVEKIDLFEKTLEMNRFALMQQQ